ncbi:squalene synthase HpnC [Lentzea sp. NPDC051213]|uniref:squalene synthase HpnC n=1 Tax=Lentzea sp. NPDC051213 TaxID=3364126 RepID=UPI0037BB4F9F
MNEVRAQATNENFPVAARILPVRVRARLLALYDFARWVDDIGDEYPPADRLGLLDQVEADLLRLYRGSPPEMPLVAALAPLTPDVPMAEFAMLIEANRRDQVKTRYETFAELLEYCALSADPVGRIVLRIFSAATPQRLGLADRVSSALQIIEHCQDVGEDHAGGRVYLPAADLSRFGCVEEDFTATSTPVRLREVVALQARRAERLLDEGRPLIGTLGGFARIAVAGYVAGGRATLTALRHAGYDVLAVPVRPARTRLLVEWSRTWAG